MNQKQFTLRVHDRYAEAMIVVGGCRIVTSVSTVPDSEADLALCLSALVQAGVIDVEKLRAALVLAEPVAREKVSELREKGGISR